jgi:hypothetical protein
MMYSMQGYELAQERHKDYLREAQKYALVQQALAGAGAGRTVRSLIRHVAQLFGRPAGSMVQEIREQRPIRRTITPLRTSA